jgi:hypothetical protein
MHIIMARAGLMTGYEANYRNEIYQLERKECGTPLGSP